MLVLIRISHHGGADILCLSAGDDSANFPWNPAILRIPWRHLQFIDASDRTDTRRISVANSLVLRRSAVRVYHEQSDRAVRPIGFVGWIGRRRVAQSLAYGHPVCGTGASAGAGGGFRGATLGRRARRNAGCHRCSRRAHARRTGQRARLPASQPKRGEHQHQGRVGRRAC